jgi:pectin lyase
MMTMKGNYIHHTSGRGIKMVGNTLLHAVNNEWYAVSGHAFDVGAGSMVVAEGNVFQNVVTPLWRMKDSCFLILPRELILLARLIWGMFVS